VPDTTTYPGTDYYEIGVVQYTHQFHKDLPPTLLRGYVQLSTAVVPGKRVPLVNENVGLDPNADIPVLLNGSPVFGVDNPSYLGPTIVATKDKPVRILFRNLLPTGTGGDLFLPVDTTVMGAGPGPNAMMLDKNNVPMDMAANDGTVTDGVRNPACGETPKPSTCYTENRATLHLHGGITPWISDGTPHQWVTPAGESTDYPKGVSVTNVPDMPDPGPGAETFFYTNQQSARLMFYHDHAWGITRLNVYAGEAAGYVITDDTEQSLFGVDPATGNKAPFADLGMGTPLIIQDKTFVPSDDQIKKVDPTWQGARWGHLGALWVPHVYMPAQNPGSATGSSQFGRWMYGPWFWPPAKNVKYAPIANPYYDPTCDPATAPGNFCEPQQIPGTPNVTVGMEAFNDTPIVNGTAYPATGVDPRAYRFRILNAANDRFWNLQWYVADPSTGTLSEVALKPAEVAAAQTDPNVFPTPDTTKSPVGPSWLQIGTEGGFLPTPTVIPNQPTTWITDPTRFDFGNVDKHALLLAPAERADVIVDFSQYRGKTLILYNDAPAAFPARQANQDYYTGDPDMTPAGAPSTLPGYGPNTRTIMKVTVSSAAPAVAFDLPNTTNDRMGKLMAAFAAHSDANGQPAGVFEKGQHPIIVGQAAYNTALGTNFTGTGWCNSPTSPTTACDGLARIQEQGGDPFKFDTVTPAATTTIGATSGGVNVATLNGSGVLNVASTTGFPATGVVSLETPNGAVQLSYTGLDPGGTAFTGVKTKAGAGVLVPGAAVNWSDVQVTLPLTSKAIHDEMNSATFDEYGRMSANLGLEAPGATPLTQNIILYPYVNPSTELIDATTLPDGIQMTAISTATDGTQIWKITHNGVDTHPLHFHLFDVQVLNRVTWDNIIMQPDANELGWKDTVRVSPLEDTIVALRPVIPRLPFAIPDSKRPLNPMMPVGAVGDLNGTINGQEAGFNNTDTAGNPLATPIANTVENFGWEYVWHCHILSHEEMDMMRPVDVHVSWNPPTAPTGLTYDQGTLRWTDGTPYSTSPAAWDMHHSEIGFRIERAPVPKAGDAPAFDLVGDAIANSQSFVDNTADPGTSYVYRVTAWNEGGRTSSNTVQVTAPAKAPTNLVATLLAGPKVQLDWTMPTDPTIASVVVEREDGVGTFVQRAVLGAGAITWTDNTVVSGLYTYRVYATNAGGSSAYAGPVSASIHASVTTVTSPNNPSTFGSPATFTATVAGIPPGTTPTGGITFAVNGTPAQAVALDANGTATFSTSTLAVGNSLITADYGGDANFVPSSGSITQTVNKARSSVSVTSSDPLSEVTRPVTFTATVTPSTARGTVLFTFDRGLPSATTRTAPVGGSGVATLVLSTLVLGTHTVDATYSGDGSYLPSTSAPITQTVRTLITSTAVTSSANPSVWGQPVTFTATVSPAGAAGSVTFSVDGVAVTTAAIDAAGQARLTLSDLSTTAHTVSATYGGATLDAPSTGAMTQTVTQASSFVSLYSSANPARRRTMVTFTATVAVSAPGAGVPTGVMRFTIDRRIYDVVLVNGTARYSTRLLAVGFHNVTATYMGDINVNPSASGVFRQRIR
jgi:FtsP/CotA-like multicopper oxidase with cupredoxin domain